MSTIEEKVYKITCIMLVAFMPLLSLAFYSQMWSPFMGSLLSLFIVLAYMGLPILVLERYSENLRAYNLYAHRLEAFFDFILAPRRNNIEKPDAQAIKHELLYFVVVSLGLLVPYALVFYGYFSLEAHLSGHSVSFTPSLPPALWQIMLTQIFVVALPEEFFWRGFVQGVLIKKWPRQPYLWGVSVGPAVLATNALFALAHFVLGFSPARLLTFFPGLIFSSMVIRQKSLLSAILFHALCNVFALFLHRSIQVFTA